MTGVVSLYGDPIGHEVLTPTSATGITSALLTPANSGPAKSALISVETYLVRFRVDGGTVTATTGHVIPAGGSYVIQGIASLKDVNFVDSAAGASVVRVTTFA